MQIQIPSYANSTKIDLVRRTGALDEISRSKNCCTVNVDRRYNSRSLRSSIMYFVAKGAKKLGQRPARVLPKKGEGIQLLGKAPKQFIEGIQLEIEEKRRESKRTTGYYRI